MASQVAQVAVLAQSRKLIVVLQLFASRAFRDAFWHFTWTFQVHLGKHSGASLGRFRCLLEGTLALHLDSSGASWETLWRLTWMLQVTLGTRSGTSLGHFRFILGGTLAPHLDASAASRDAFWHLTGARASWEALWHPTWTLQVPLGTHSGISLARFRCILGGTLAPHLDSAGASRRVFW